MNPATLNSAADDGLELVVIPTLRARFMPDGTVRTTAKFIDGMRMYARLWPGPVAAILRHSELPDGNLDPVIVDPADLPFGLFRADLADERALARAVVDAAVVLASLDCDQTHISGVCRRLGVPCVYASEYSLTTRRQVIAATTRNPLLRLRRYLWTTRLETRQVDALRLASGLQCNGTPTYDAYHGLTPSPLLYFDTRVTRPLLAPTAAVEARVKALADGAPLRLAFSGRVARMKGADHLPAIVESLRRRGIAITLDVFGDGECLASLSRSASRSRDSRVRFCGVVDFATELMPTLARDVDLAVLPHPQGDPACTYMETLSAGVPIASYANEAWLGLIRHARASGHTIGAAVRIGDPAALAEAIASLHHDRARLAAMTRSSRAFAEAHTFEATFSRRVDHLLSLCRCADRLPEVRLQA